MNWIRDPRKKIYAKRYGLSQRQIVRLFSGTAEVEQLEACKDEAARRLLLGVSKKKGTGIRGQGTGR